MSQFLHYTRIKVVVADDALPSRLGTIALLASAGLEILPPGATDLETAMQLPTDIDETLELVRTYEPDVVVMDIKWRSDDFAGIRAARQIKDDLPSTRVILFSIYFDRERVLRAVLEGQVDGYVLKNRARSLPDAIRTVFPRGSPYFVPEAVEHLLSIIRAPEPVVFEDRDPLNDTELEVLRHMARGETNRIIAERLSLAEATVKTRNNRIYQKLRVYEGAPDGAIEPRVMAVLKGLQRGYLNLSDLVPCSREEV